MMSHEDMQKPFEITSVCRADITDLDVSLEHLALLTDADMQELASDLEDSYLDQLFWQSLRAHVEFLFEKKGIKNATFPEENIEVDES